jgi:glutamine amidotransferase
VGAFALALANIAKGRLTGVLEEAVVRRNNPTLGICLGMQILAQSSTEMGSHTGLSFVPGDVVRLGGPLGLPIPHVGWNQVEARLGSILFDGIPSGASFYFDHSFSLRDSPYTSATCNYDGLFVAAMERGALMAVQFHPEKSQTAGLRLLSNFCSFAARARSPGGNSLVA